LYIVFLVTASRDTIILVFCSFGMMITFGSLKNVQVHSFFLALAAFDPIPLMPDGSGWVGEGGEGGIINVGK
jgi:hypothetical protein